MKNLATPSSIFIFVLSSSTGGLCSQPVRGNDRRIGRTFPEHVERSFLDPEYSFDEYFQLGSRRNIHPVKNRLKPRSHKITSMNVGLWHMRYMQDFAQSSTQPLLFGTYTKQRPEKTNNTNLGFWHMHWGKTAQDHQHERWSITHTLKDLTRSATRTLVCYTYTEKT